jgi:tryptophan-rich sensory protein
VAFSGGYFTSLGLKKWYKHLKLPMIAPPGKVIGLVWTILYILTAFSLIEFIRLTLSGQYYWLVMSIFIINGLLNILWSYSFFAIHKVYGAIFVSMGIAVSVLCLMILIYPDTELSSYLLLPYFIWICFASYLNYQIWVNNGFRAAL